MANGQFLRCHELNIVLIVSTIYQLFLESMDLFGTFVVYYSYKLVSDFYSIFSIMGLIGALIIGFLAGFIANKLMGKGGGLLWDLFFGVNGGLLGGYLFDLLNISLGGIVGQLVTSVVGAVIVLWIASFFRK